MSHVWSLRTVEHHSAGEGGSDTRGTGINLEGIVLSEMRQSQKDKYCRIPCKWVPRAVTFIETGSRMVAAGAGGGERGVSV